MEQYSLPVSVTKCNSYDSDKLRDSVSRHFRLLGIKIDKNKRVLIKPNLIAARPTEHAATTDPRLIRAVVELLLDMGVKDITIADSPGGTFTKKLLKDTYRVCGIRELEELGVRLNYNTDFSQVNSSDFRICSSFNIIDVVKNADIIINMAKLKTHGMMTYSGAVKNLFGVIPGLQKPQLHFRYPDRFNFAEMIVDLCETVKPYLSIIDGIVGMEGEGPTNGRPRKFGFLFASRNAYSLDLLASEMIGIKPEENPIIYKAIERGLCPDSIDKLNIVGRRLQKDDFADFRKPPSKSLTFSDKIPPPFNKLFIAIVTPSPRVIKDRCIGCGKCAESCPAKIITFKDKKAVINKKSGCIKCYCCHEMCPVNAIRIKRIKLFDK